jgi:hypothetical protein
MANWFKRKKNGSTTFTTSSKGTTTSSSIGNSSRRVTTTRKADGSIKRTITERMGGMTKRTTKTIQKKRK